MRASRQGRARLPRPAPSDLARAARELHAQLTLIVRKLDEGLAQKASDAETWSTLRFVEMAPVRGGLSPRPTILSALQIVAERELDRLSRLQGARIARLSLELVRGETMPDDALRQVRGARPLQMGDLEELKSAIARARSERQKWKAAYGLLADGVDVWPAPDTRSGLRGPLRTLYEHVARPR